MDKVYPLNCPLVDMSPIAVEPDFTRKYLQSSNNETLVKKITKAFDRVAWEKDFVLCEGSGHAGVGSVFDLSNAQVAKILGAKVIIISQGGIGKPIDEVYLNQAVFEKEGVEIIGVILNKVTADKIDYITEFARRGLKRKGLDLLGVLPHREILSRPTVESIQEDLKAERLNSGGQANAIVGSVVIGAMGAQNAISYFKPGCLVITPGDREDVFDGRGHRGQRAQPAPVRRGIDRKSPPQSGCHAHHREGFLPCPARRRGQLRGRLARPQPHRQDPARRHGKDFRHSRHHRRKRRCQQNIARHLSLYMNLPFELNPVLRQLPVYQPGRPIGEVARELGLPERRIIKLASNENPLGPSPAALAAMKVAARQVHLYPDGNAFYFKQKLAAHLQVGPGNLILGNGSNDIIEFLGHALMGPGVDVIVSEYCFAIYPIVARLLGANVITVPAKGRAHDLPAMGKAITPQTKVVFVANPNNPTGTLGSADDVRRLIDSTPSNVVLVMDEAYIEFLEEPLDLIPLIRRSEKPNLILMRTFSKIYGLAGLRLGYGIAHPAFVAALEKIRQPFNVNLLAQAAGLAALDDSEHVRKTRENNFQGRKFLQDAFAEMGLEFEPSHANFVLVRVGQGQKVFEEMQKQGVITRPMGGYQLPEWIRISVGTPAENRRAIKTLKGVLAVPGN